MPARTGVNVHYKTMERLSHIENIVGIKDTSGNFDNMQRYLESCGDRISVLSGNDSLILPCLLAGGRGGISGISNVLPERMVRIYTAWQEGDMDLAWRVQRSIRPLRDCMGMEIPTRWSNARRRSSVRNSVRRAPRSMSMMKNWMTRSARHSKLSNASPFEERKMSYDESLCSGRTGESHFRRRLHLEAAGAAERAGQEKSRALCGYGRSEVRRDPMPRSRPSRSPVRASRWSITSRPSPKTGRFVRSSARSKTAAQTPL